MKKHDDCFDRCQLNEMKGYGCCAELSGTCELLEADDNEQTIEDHQRQENRYLNRQNAKSINRKVE